MDYEEDRQKYTVRDPAKLSKKQLVEMAARLLGFMYMEAGDDGKLYWMPDHDVAGSDLVEVVDHIFKDNGLYPKKVGPKDWSPKKGDTLEL